MLSYYDLRLFNPNGSRIGNLNTLSDFEFGRQKNDIGACTLTLPAELYNEISFTKDCMLEIWRYNEAENSFILVGQTLWFLRTIERTLSNQTEDIILVFFDSISLLQRRVIPWFSVDPIKTGIDNYPSVFFQHLDDTLKMIFFHNFNVGAIDPTLNTFAPVFPGGPAIPPGVPAAQRVENILQAPYLSLAPIANISFAWRNVLDAMQEVCSVSESFNVPLWFDIIYEPNTADTIGQLTFTTWTNLRGVDLTDSVKFGPEFGNIDNLSLLEDYTEEATIIYATGKEDPPVDDGIEEVLVASVQNTNLDPQLIFYPIEATIAVSSDAASINIELLESQARVELANRSPIISLTGDILQAGANLFFINYNYGDLVTVTWKNILFDAEITKFDVSVGTDDEVIKIPLESKKNLTVVSSL